MIFRESETVELKEVVVDDIKKEVIAFANCRGGKIYVGVDDEGEIIGVDDEDAAELMDALTDGDISEIGKRKLKSEAARKRKFN